MVPNGGNPDDIRSPTPERLAALRRQLGLEDRFVVSYVGTLGTAHRADILLEAAEGCSDPGVAFEPERGASWILTPPIDRQPARPR